MEARIIVDDPSFVEDLVYRVPDVPHRPDVPRCSGLLRVWGHEPWK
jgi:hypothetical protein